MRNKHLFNLSIIGIVATIFFFFNTNLFCFDRQKAVEYANNNWNKRPSEYCDYEKCGGDCANFGSQVLIAGGISMNATNEKCDTDCCSSKTYCRAESLKNFLESIGATSVNLRELERGDIIFLLPDADYPWWHTLVVLRVFYDQNENRWDADIAAHTSDRNTNFDDETLMDKFANRSKVFIHIPGPPQVESTSPDNGATDVSVCTDIDVIFDIAMDTSISPSSFMSISPSVEGSWSWVGDKSVKFTYSGDGFDYITTYTVTVTKDAKDKCGNELDGNKDGTPGDDYVFSFTTQDPKAEVWAEPPTAVVPVGDSKTHTIKINNKNCKMIRGGILDVKEVPPTSPGWSWGYTTGMTDVAPFSTGADGNVTVKNNSCFEGEINLDMEVLVMGYKTKNWLFSYFYTHINDNPDETQSVSTISSTLPYNINKDSKTLLLLGGFADNSMSLLGKLGESFNLVRKNFEVFRGDGKTIRDYPVLIVPTLGLYGMSNSSIFKSQLENYVAGGGTLVVFTQQHGYEFNTLPGGVSGYGWAEDQSCIGNASVIEEYHQILSSQKDLQFAGGIDGFFSQWTENTKVLLRRTKNNMPALILYPYGQGYVIATTLYTDFSYAQGSITQDELALMRDIITWAKNPKEYIEVKPSQEITIPVTIVNNTDKDADKVKFVVRDSLSVIREEVIDLVVPAGQIITYNYTFTAPENLGMYSISYTLMTNAQLLMTDIFADNFSVSQHLQQIIPSPDLTFLVTAVSELSPYLGVRAEIINNSDKDRRFKITYRSNDSNRWCQWSPSLLEEVSVPANSKFEKIYYDLMCGCSSWWRVWLTFFNEQGSPIGSSSVAGKCYPISFNLSLKPDKEYYKVGENVGLGYFINSLSPNADDYELEIKAFEPDDNIFSTSKSTINIRVGSSTNSGNFSIILPEKLFSGKYKIVGNLKRKDGVIVTSQTAYFQIEQAKATITPTIPTTIDPALENQITFEITNTGAIDAVAKLELTLKDPEGIITWSDAKEFSIAQGITEILDFTLPIISNLRFGNYKLIYKITTQTGILSGSKDIPNNAVFSTTFDKSSYRVRESMKVDVSVMNTGKFVQNIDVICKILDTSQTQNITLQPQETKNLNYTITIPETLIFGSHNLDVTLSLANQLKKTWTFFIPESKLQLSLDKLNYNIGEAGQIKIENTGGVDTSYDYRLKIEDLKNINILNTTGTGTIKAGETKTISFSITNPQILSGTYRLSLYCEDKKTNKKQIFERYLEISGVSAKVQVETDKKMYMKGETITAKTKIKPSQPIQDAKLSIKIYSGEESITNYSGFGTIFAIAVEKDKVYFGTAQGFVKKFNFG